MEDGVELQKLMINGDIDPTAFVTHKVQLEDLPSAFGAVIEFREGLLKAIVVR
jgi:threonine dehydrogenase-like Zn-dependent dehydrogenase